ncbi:hypothetical protein LINPERHAP1_LOCUS5760 [Linum perenne]
MLVFTLWVRLRTSLRLSTMTPWTGFIQLSMAFSLMTSVSERLHPQSLNSMLGFQSPASCTVTGSITVR